MVGLLLELILVYTAVTGKMDLVVFLIVADIVSYNVLSMMYDDGENFL